MSSESDLANTFAVIEAAALSLVYWDGGCGTDGPLQDIECLFWKHLVHRVRWLAPVGFLLDVVSHWSRWHQISCVRLHLKVRIMLRQTVTFRTTLPSVRSLVELAIISFIGHCCSLRILRNWHGSLGPAFLAIRQILVARGWSWLVNYCTSSLSANWVDARWGIWPHVCCLAGLGALGGLLILGADIFSESNHEIVTAWDANNWFGFKVFGNVLAWCEFLVKGSNR